MEDPNTGRLDVGTAEEILDLSEIEKIVMRNAAAIDLLIQQSNLSERDVQIAYEQRLKVQLREVRDNLDSLVRGGLDED